MSVPRLLLTLCVLVSLLISCHALQCSTAIPAAQSFTHVSCSENSGLFAYSLLGAVQFKTTSFPSTNFTFFTPFPPCFVPTIPASHPKFGQVADQANPLFVKSLDVANWVAVLGQPNHDATQLYSHVGVVRVSATSVQGHSIIESFDSAVLGTLVSLNTAATRVATTFSWSDIHVYSPVFNRINTYWNQAGDSDTALTLPAQFTVDSLHLRGTVLAVTAVKTAATCQPYLLIYDLVGSTWNLRSSTVIARIAPTSSIYNSIACQGEPSNALPVRQSDDGAFITIGVPSWKSAFVTSTSTISFSYLYGPASRVQNADFGSWVGWAGSGAEHLIVQSYQTLYTFDRQTFLRVANNFSRPATTTSIKPDETYEYIVPNRLETYAALTDQHFVQFCSSYNFTAGLLNEDLSLPQFQPVVSVPRSPPGYRYSSSSDAFVGCPIGSFRSESNFGPCEWCETGKYQPAEGQSDCVACSNGTYCVLGSSMQITEAAIEADEESEYLPEFEAESFREVFEELLVNSIFSNKSTTMIILYVFIIISFLLFLATILPLPPLINSWAYWLISVYRFLDLPEENEEEIHYLFHKLEKHLKKYPDHAQHPILLHPVITDEDENGGLKSPSAASPSAASPSASPTNGSDDSEPVKNAKVAQAVANLQSHGHHHQGHISKHASHSAIEADAEAHHIKLTPEEEEEMKYMSPEQRQHHLNEMERDAIIKSHAKKNPIPSIIGGFFNIILLLFFISAISFAATFLNSYSPTAEHHEGSTPINRYGYENLLSMDNVDEVIARGISAINSINVTIRIDMIGMSGIECSKDSVRIVFDGCQITGSPLRCDDASNIHVEENHEEFANTCRFELDVPTNSLFSNIARLSFFFQPTVHVMAARISYLQYEQAAPTEEDVNNFRMGNTLFHELLLHPSNSSTHEYEENYLSPLVSRDWVVGILAFTYQDTEDSPPHYYMHFYNTIAPETPPEFPRYTKEQYIIEQNSEVEFRINLYTNSFWRRQTLERLIQPKVAFLTVLLALIAIYHIVEFAHQLFEVTWIMLMHARKWSERKTRKARRMTRRMMLKGAAHAVNFVKSAQKAVSPKTQEEKGPAFMQPDEVEMKQNSLPNEANNQQSNVELQPIDRQV